MENNIENEEWRDIDGYDGVYQVSDLGRVRSLKYGKVRVLKPQKDNKGGYLLVNLYRDGKLKHFLVHRLVASAFIPNDDESKTIINHKNEKPSQNFVNNLEWCTQQYNVTYNDLNLRKKNVKRHKLKDIYDQNLTYAQNIEIFRANGIECSEKTVLRLRKDLGLTKHYSPRKKAN